jgi:hypothetical protein
MKNLKKYLDDISGKEIHSVSVLIRLPYDSRKTKLSFNLKIESVKLTEVLTIKFNIFNRKVNDESDDPTFEYLFSKNSFQEEFERDTYENYNLAIFGVKLEDLELIYDFV